MTRLYVCIPASNNFCPQYIAEEWMLRCIAIDSGQESADRCASRWRETLQTNVGKYARGIEHAVAILAIDAIIVQFSDHCEYNRCTSL